MGPDKKSVLAKFCVGEISDMSRKEAKLTLNYTHIEPLEINDVRPMIELDDIILYEDKNSRFKITNLDSELVYGPVDYDKAYSVDDCVYISYEDHYTTDHGNMQVEHKEAVFKQVYPVEREIYRGPLCAVHSGAPEGQIGGIKMELVSPFVYHRDKTILLRYITKSNDGYHALNSIWLHQTVNEEGETKKGGEKTKDFNIIQDHFVTGHGPYDIPEQELPRLDTRHPEITVVEQCGEIYYYDGPKSWGPPIDGNDYMGMTSSYGVMEYDENTQKIYTYKWARIEV